jgi:RimJ/RimL family protein N-acetyltransferase
MIRTARLLLRPWQEADRASLAAISADPEVMRHFVAPRDRAASDRWMDRTQAHIAAHGFGIWAVEYRATADLIGFVGLCHVPAGLPCAPAVEAVWTLGAAWWKQGFAAEAARAAIMDGFSRLGLAEIVAFTTPGNLASQAVMRALGMTREAGDDFEHPLLPEGHVLRPHRLYRLKNPGDPA